MYTIFPQIFNLILFIKYRKIIKYGKIYFKEFKLHISNLKKGVLYTTIGAVGWGVSGVCSQFLFTDYGLDSSWLTAIRMFFSGILLLSIGYTKEQKKIVNIFKSKKDIGWLLAFAIIGLLLCQYSFLSAIKHSNSATATVLQSLNVVMMAITVSILHKKPIAKKQFVSVFLAVIGVYLITTNGNPSEMILSAQGLLWGLLSGVGIVTYTLLSQDLLTRYRNIVVTGWGMLIGGTVMCIATGAWNIPDNFDFIALLMVAVVVTIGTAVGFTLFLQGAKLIGPVKATLIGCLEPVSATILSAVFLGTTFGFIELIGFAFIMITVFISMEK